MTDLLNVPITFNSVSVGKEQVSVGIGIDRERVARTQMGELFVNRRLEVDLSTGEPGEQPLPGIKSDRVTIFGAFISNSYSEKEESFTTRLTTPKSAVEPTDFWNLSGRSGRLVVRSVDDADREGPLSEPTSEPLPGQREFPAEAPPEPEDIKIPFPASCGHTASIRVRRLNESNWGASWNWSAENGHHQGQSDVEYDGGTREDAIYNALDSLVAAMDDVDYEPTSKVGKKRRESAIDTVEKMLVDLDSGGKTIFETHPAEAT